MANKELHPLDGRASQGKLGGGLGRVRPATRVLQVLAV